MNTLGNSRGVRATRLVFAGAVLLWLGPSAPVMAAEGKPRVSVVDEAPRLSVEARDVSLTEVLRAIGAEAGFAVVDTGGARPRLTVSLKGKTLDAVLQELLRPENYVFVYREDGGGKAASRIETIVLLGPVSPGGGSPEAGAGQPVQSGSRAIAHDDATFTPSYDLPPAEQPMVTPPADRGGARGARASEQAATGPAPRANEAKPRVAGTPTGPNHPIPAGAPDPALVQDQILQHVRTMVDAVRQTTLDTPRGNRYP